MYQLYFKKEDFELRVEPLTAWAKDITDIPKRFNDCIYVCNNRKALRELAKQIKAEWIAELEEKLENAKNIKVKNKY